MGLKYIVINSFQIMLFAPHIDHGYFFRRVQETSKDNVTGAGRVSSDWRCHGESVSLGIGVGKTDQDVLDHAMRGA